MNLIILDKASTALFFRNENSCSYIKLLMGSQQNITILLEIFLYNIELFFINF